MAIVFTTEVVGSLVEANTADEHVFGDARDAIRARAIAAGLDTVLEDWATDDQDPDPYLLLLYLPNGREKRTVAVTAGDADEIAAVPFEEFVILGDYRAMYNRQDKTIEALLRPPTPRSTARLIVELPGSEIRRRDPDTGTVGDLVGDVLDLRAELELPPDKSVWRIIAGDSEYTWRLPISNPPGRHEVEISPASRSMKALVAPDRATTPAGWRPTLKIANVEYENHDVAVALMEDFASCVLFDLDLRFDVPLFLERRERFPRLVTTRRPKKSSQPLTFPTVKYSSSATTLYFYSKASKSMPLLQYLAFYQAIEFFFPAFFEQELISRVRNQMRDPRFEWASDDMVKRVIGLSQQGGRGPVPEREQLRATLTASLEEDDVRKLLPEGSDAAKFVGDKAKLKGVPPIGLRSPAKIIDQLSDRIYAIRCRIVHSKDAGSPVSADPLLPYSAESSRLDHDLKLIEYVCQKVIIAGATSR